MSKPVNLTLNSYDYNGKTYYDCNVNLHDKAAVGELLNDFGDNIIVESTGPKDVEYEQKGKKESKRMTYGTFKLLHDGKLYQIKYIKKTFSGRAIMRLEKTVTLDTKNISEKVIEKIGTDKPRALTKYETWRKMALVADANEVLVNSFLKTNLTDIVERSIDYVGGKSSHAEIFGMIDDVKPDDMRTSGYLSKYTNKKEYTVEERKKYKADNNGNAPPKFLDREFPTVRVSYKWGKNQSGDIYTRTKFKKNLKLDKVSSQYKRVNTKFGFKTVPIEISPEDDLQTLRKNIYPLGKVELTFTKGLRAEKGKAAITYDFKLYKYCNLKHMDLKWEAGSEETTFESKEDMLAAGYDDCDYSDDDDDNTPIADPYAKLDEQLAKSAPEQKEDNTTVLVDKTLLTKPTKAKTDEEIMKEIENMS